MPITTLNPTVATTPDQGGTLGVSGAINTGHSSTVTSASAFDIEAAPPANDSQARSARWSSFQAAPAGLIGLKLKFEWTAIGTVGAEVVTGGSASGSIDFVIEYTLNGGSSWTPAVTRSRDANQSGDGLNSDSINDGGSVEVVLSTSQNISQVQVRDRMDAAASASAPNGVPGAEANGSGSITTTISGIRLEAETPALPEFVYMPVGM